MRISRIFFSSARLLNCIALILLVMFTACTISCNRKNNKVTEAPPSLMPPQPPVAPSMIGADTIWDFTGKLPLLPGNEEALFDYIGRKLVYPTSAKENNIQGKVIVKFCVTREGKVINHEVIKSVHPDLDAEALRVIKTITKFEPGYYNGKTITVYYEVPISFVLK